MVSVEPNSFLEPLLSSFESSPAPKNNSKQMATASFRKINSGDLYVSKPTHWLESRFHFSFAEYYNPKNQNFGVLRVMNDDIVKPRNGFGMHPHRDQEIISYIVEGYLTHQDSQGNKETLGRGSVQYMSAGRGVYHSEMNESKDKYTRFIQIWISPSSRGLPTQYGSRTYDPKQRLNTLHHIVAPINAQNNKELIGINQDANIFVSEVTPGSTIHYELKENRQSYLLCIEGDLLVSGEQSTSNRHLQESLTTRDALEIVGPVNLSFTSPNGASSNALLLMIEMEQE
eukprot:TRINITY_DN14726_c0_g1_i1.p1 TRINITY_DN14726_c0_g1~~TRINITY_DN14726_c0_g1_i1.p1  ORF type:complete len:286 (+),score=41.42 TRINITY_DN14726_c0_g1_i1:161-1018(+)